MFRTLLSKLTRLRSGPPARASESVQRFGQVARYPMLWRYEVNCRIRLLARRRHHAFSFREIFGFWFDLLRKRLFFLSSRRRKILQPRFRELINVNSRWSFFGEAAQNVRLTRPQPRKTPEAYPLGYVEDFSEVRTKLAGVFSSR